MDILLGGDPEVLGALQTVVVLGGQSPILVAIHDAHSFGHVLHDMKALEDNFGGGQRNRFENGLDGGFPHVHCDCLDACELLRGAGLLKSHQARLFPSFCNVLDGAAIKVIHDGVIMMTFAERLLIDADTGDGAGLLASQPGGNGSLKDVPGLIPTVADERAGTLNGLTGLEDVEHEPLHEQREAAVGLCPRHRDLYHSVLQALDPWNTCMDERVELAGVQMPPLPLGGVVVAGQLPATMRAVAAAAFRMLEMNVDFR
jgi:hypothetical protein